MLKRASLFRLFSPAQAALVLALATQVSAQSASTRPGRVANLNSAFGQNLLERAWSAEQNETKSFDKIFVPAGPVMLLVLRENSLSRGSILQAMEPTSWGRYKWRIVSVAALLVLETVLIAALLFERKMRWRATRHLAESEERYRNVVETQTELICRFLPDTTLTFVNDAYCRYFGKTREQLIGSKFTDYIPAHARDAAQQHVLSMIEKQRIEVNEHEVIRPDGSIGWQQWTNHVISRDRQVELQGIGRDVTAHRLAVQAKQESEERFAKAFNANPQPMSLTTLSEGRYLDVNESFLRMSGYTREEVIGHTSSELGNYETPTYFGEEVVEQLSRTGVLRNLESNFRTKDGALRTLLTSAEMLELDGQKCILVASSDITERKQSERWLADLTGRLLRAQDEERRRIAEELHDVTAQAIGVILLNLAYLRKATPKIDSRAKDKLSECSALGEQALKEIRTLSYVLHPPLLDQAGLVTALQWYAKGFSERSGIRVDFNERGSDGNRLPADVEYSLFRVVQECLTNIRRHTTSELADILLTRTADEVVLQVCDQGTGIRPASSNGDGIESVGVGIAGMRHRLKQLGGELKVDSTPNGTTVTATVPVYG